MWRWMAEAILAGVLLGTAARLAMRVLAWLAGSAGGFSRGGSVEIVVFGALLGAPIALALFLLRQWRGWTHPWIGLWTALALYIGALARPSPSAQAALASSPLPGWQVLLIFGLVFFAFGLWIDLARARGIDCAGCREGPSQLSACGVARVKGAMTASKVSPDAVTI